MSTQKATNSPPRRFLVHDEVERLPTNRGVLHPFRVRVWRGVDATPVVLVSQARDGVPPHWMVNKLANWVFSATLGYPETGMLYFEDEDHNGRRVLQQVFFEFFGNAHRLRLFKPSTRDASLTFLEHIVGGPIDR